MKRSAAAAAYAIAIALSPAAGAQDMQAKRLAFIDRLTKQGVFHKLERPARLCHLHVGPRFDALSFDDKQGFVNVVYAYCVTERPQEKIVVLKDYRTNKEIGTYSEAAGGLRLR